MEIEESDIKGNVVVLGGGGVIGPDLFQPSVTKIKNFATATIGWGIGHNVHGDTRPDWGPYKDGYALLGIRDYDAPLGIRDYGGKDGVEWVPCPSCMSHFFDKPQPPLREVVFYYHHDTYLDFQSLVKKVPSVNNCAVSIGEAVEFLSSGSIVLTTTYHGAYWGALLGRRVVVLSPNSSRFYGMKFPVSYSDPSNWENNIPATQPPSDFLLECRERNVQFSRKVQEYLDARA